MALGKHGKSVYIRPEDVVEFVKELCKQCGSIEELREHLNTMNYYLKHEKFEKLQDVFGIEF